MVYFDIDTDFGGCDDGTLEQTGDPQRALDIDGLYPDSYDLPERNHPWPEPEVSQINYGMTAWMGNTYGAI